MDNHHSIEINHVSKKYNINGQQTGYRTLRESIMDIISLKKRSSPPPDQSYIWSLDDLSLNVEKGKVLGIIGRNGAGKSTLLKVISRITKPTKGDLQIRGKVGSLLEVGTGFHPELTGRENVYLNGAILGMSKADVNRKFDEIVSFAEVEKFIDTPIKHYSSGMYMRLAFSVAAHLETDILLVDEVLTVGDIGFQKKCIQKMETVGQNGCTVITVSHDRQLISSLSHQIMWLEKGKVKEIGEPEYVLNAYQRSFISGDDFLDGRVIRQDQTKAIKWIEIRNEAGNPASVFANGDSFILVAGIDQHLPPASYFEWRLNNEYGQFITCDITYLEGKNSILSDFNGQLYSKIGPLPLSQGTYSLSLKMGVIPATMFDYWDEATTISISKCETDYGKIPFKSHDDGIVYIPTDFYTHSI
jgi:lipopolysaccharide transport system ATP-binding protein